MFSQYQLSFLDQALAVLANPPSYTIESWENENDAIELDDFAIQLYNPTPARVSARRYVVYELDRYPGTYHEPPEVNEQEIGVEPTFYLALIRVMQELIKNEIENIMTMDMTEEGA
jgi:hypothetical protein